MKKLVIALTLSAIASISIAQTEKVTFDTSKLKQGDTIANVMKLLKPQANAEITPARPANCDYPAAGSSVKFTPKVAGGDKQALIVAFCDDHMMEYKTVSR